MRDPKYKGNWKNVKDKCQLCRMSKKTEWHLETKKFVICEKLGGGPMIVSKRHEQELSERKMRDAKRLTSLLFDDFEFRVLMSHCENHFHAHIITDEDPNLAGE